MKAMNLCPDFQLKSLFPQGADWVDFAVTDGLVCSPASPKEFSFGGLHQCDPRNLLVPHEGYQLFGSGTHHGAQVAVSCKAGCSNDGTVGGSQKFLR